MKANRKKTIPGTNLLSLIARETVNAISIINLDGTIEWVNESFTRITEYSLKESLGKKHSKLLHGPETDFLTIESMKESFNKQKAFTAEILNYSKAGKKIWFLLSAQPIRDSTGTIESFFIMLTDITEQKKLQDELKANQKEMTNAIIEAQEKERALIGRELHDNINQVLTSVKLYNELCLENREMQSQLLIKSIEQLQLCINEIRGLSHRLSTPFLGNIKIKDSVSELVQQINETKKVAAYLNTEQLNDLEVTLDIHITIFRILQEHLTNVLKHSFATKVQIDFYLKDDYLVLKVMDNGRGFNTCEKIKGIGITNMKSRVENVKGKFNINSKPGLGCVLTVQFPNKTIAEEEPVKY